MEVIVVDEVVGPSSCLYQCVEEVNVEVVVAVAEFVILVKCI